MNRRPWEGRSYTKEDYERTVDDLVDIPELNKGAAESELLNLLGMSVPLEEAKMSLYDRHNATHLLSHEYERVESWNGELPPPKISEDDWVEFSPSDGRNEVRSKGSELGMASGYTVYVVNCEFRHESVREVEQQANLLFGEIPGWVSTAWEADHSLYIGYSSELGRRLESHAVGNLSDHRSPSRVTALSDVVATGVVARTPDEDTAMEVEENYAENLEAIKPDNSSIFIYQF